MCGLRSADCGVSQQDVRRRKRKEDDGRKGQDEVMNEIGDKKNTGGKKNAIIYSSETTIPMPKS